MRLSESKNLKELPDLSNATNLEILSLDRCFSLVEIPSSIGNLQKLERLDMRYCMMLQVVPTLVSLASLKSLDMLRCCRLRKFPDISRNITCLSTIDTLLQDLPESIRLWSRLKVLVVFGSGPDIEKLSDCIKDLYGLEDLCITDCPKLASLPELPASLRRLIVENCESLEALMPFPLESPVLDYIYFNNCMKLGEEARRSISQQAPSYWKFLDHPFRDK